MGEQIKERGPFQSCKFSPAALRQDLVSQGAQGIFTTHLTQTRCHELHMSSLQSSPQMVRAGTVFIQAVLWNSPRLIQDVTDKDKAARTVSLWLAKPVGSSLRSCDKDWLCTGGLMSFLYSFQGDWAARALLMLWQGEINCNYTKEFGPKLRFPWKEVWCCSQHQLQLGNCWSSGESWTQLWGLRPFCLPVLLSKHLQPLNQHRSTHHFATLQELGREGKLNAGYHAHTSG